MDDDIIRAYQEKLRRDTLASKFAHEIQRPHHNPHRNHIDSEDVEALAIAIERSTPDQVAQWIKTLLEYACDDDVWDDDFLGDSPPNDGNS